MKKKYWQFLFIFAMTILFVFPLNLYPTSALIFASEGNERYTIQISNLSCEITDYEVNLDLWHLSVAGSYTVMLNNFGDTDVSIRWNDDGAQGEMITPANTVKKYSINFSFHLLSRDFSYEYEEIPEYLDDVKGVKEKDV